MGNFLKRMLPLSLYKLLANGVIIVPKYYSSIINNAERWFNLSLEESSERDVQLMRKYGHILDKGLHRVDVSKGHSRSCYESLCLVLKKLSMTKYAADPTYEWALSKKKAYETLQNNPEDFHPLVGDTVESRISYEDLFDLIKKRRSNRSFITREISQDVMLKLKETVNWASSSCNKQPIRIFATNDPILAGECLKCCKGGTGFSSFIPSFWVFTANVRGYVWPTEMYLPSIDTSLGAQNVFLSATTLGLSGTILSWAQSDDKEDQLLREKLNIPIDYQIVFCAVLGYAAMEFQCPVRKIID